MIRNELTQLVAEAAKKAQETGGLPPVAIPNVPVEHPQNPDHGDYASTLPLKLARAARMSPMAIAEAVRGQLAPTGAVAEINVAQPGFINFSLSSGWLAQQVEAVLNAGESYGRSDLGKGARVQLEFVSANPTGPLHVGGGRGAVLGSTLANLLRSAGYKVATEYYINDTGNQIEVFQRSLRARYLQALGQDAPFPEDGYGGAYLVELAQAIVAEHGDRFLNEPQGLTQFGMSRILGGVQADLEELGVQYDNWFSEASLYQDGTYELVMEQLASRGYVVEKEGAKWFVSTALGDDKDNVLVRASGVPTYFASDIAYHYDKLVKRGFQRAINIWGADHQGHVSRLKAAVSALGIEPERLAVLITQMVTLRRGAEIVKLSKRAGEIISMREVLEEVGTDPCRYFFLSRSADSQMDFDLELAKRQSHENPVYYVQYAHARVASVLRIAEERGLDPLAGNVSRLSDEAELGLIRKMLLLPELVESAAETLEPQALPHYALDLATAFHNFYERCRIISEDEALTLARLELVAATRIVLGRVLSLMGMSAPERM